MADLSVSIGDLRIKNPVIAAAGEHLIGAALRWPSARLRSFRFHKRRAARLCIDEKRAMLGVALE